MTDEKATPGVTRIPETPRVTGLDKLRDVGIATAAAVPALITHLPVAGPLAVLLNAALGQPTSKRWTVWAEEMGETVRQLVEERGIPLEALTDNPAFQNGARRATEAAMKDARREKWEMLRNAIVNSALPGSFDEDVQQHFFQLIDELGVTPVAILEAITNPQDEAKTGVPVVFTPRVYDQEILEFLKKRLGKTPADEPDLCLFLDQLAARGLLPENDTGPPWRGTLHRFRNLTPMGQRFLAFVKSPPSPNAG